MLNTNTLVQIGVYIRSTSIYKSISNDMSKNEKSGGGANILIINYLCQMMHAVGTYVKITGLTMVPLSPYTLVPLGILMYLYDKMNMKEVGTKIK